MKAMILAAGFGTRLKPLTDTKPKALVEINGVPMLEHVLKRLIKTGVREVIINLHHLPDMIASFLKTKNYFGIRIELSYEETILGTGGGLKKAAYFFDDNQPFIVHNVDVFSNINLKAMYAYHIENGALVTLAVQDRNTLRPLIVDSQNHICGHKLIKEDITRLAREPVGEEQFLNFIGIHVISPEIFDHFKEEGRFSIITTYLRLISEGKKIIAYRADDSYYKDVGKPTALREVEADIAAGIVRI